MILQAAPTLHRIERWRHLLQELDERNKVCSCPQREEDIASYVKNAEEKKSLKLKGTAAQKFLLPVP